MQSDANEASNYKCTRSFLTYRSIGIEATVMHSHFKTSLSLEFINPSPSDALAGLMMDFVEIGSVNPKCETRTLLKAVIDTI